MDISADPVARAVTWGDMGVRVSRRDLRVVEYRPYGELNFLQLPAPILAFVAGPLGVTFQCEDGVYHLTSDLYRANDPFTWRVRLVWSR